MLSFCSGGLPIHRVHDIRVPHAGQALFYPGPDERWRPALSFVTTWRLQRGRDEVLCC